MTNFIFNDKSALPKRRELRKHQTKPEEILWSKLRRKQLKGQKFFRQYSVGPYILDFYCPKAKLGIELDGGHHDFEDVRAYDKYRTQFISNFDIKIIRFWNTEVFENLDGVLLEIYSHL